MNKQNKLTPGQEEDKKEHRKQLKAMDKAIFHNGPNRANPWAKKKAVGESMTFIQHLLENEPTSKENLLEVNSADFLNILLAAAGEEPLREGELEGFPKHMTVGELIDIYEGRMPPPRMNYNFDEVDPDVDAKSFSRAGAARRKAARSDDYDREMGFQDSAREKTRSGRFQGMDAEERNEYQAMHGTEEEESRLPAVRDRAKVSKGVRDRTPVNRGGVKHAKRRAQIAGRVERSMHGKGSGGGQYLDNLFGKGGGAEDYD